MSQTTAPAPKRRNWILRATAVLVLIVILAPAGYWCWGIYQHHLLNELVAKLHAAGKPVLPEDFNRASSDSANNPVPELRVAAETLPHGLDMQQSAADEAEMQRWNSALDAEFPLSASESSMLREIVAAHRVALSHVDDGLQKKGKADWKIRFESPVIQTHLTDLDQQGMVAKVLLLATMDAHQRGDDAEAIRRVSELLLVSRSLYRAPFLVGHLVAVEDGALATTALERITPDLRIGTDVRPGRSATPRDIRSLIARLLDDRDQRAGIEYGWRSERMMELDSALWAAEGRGDPQHSRTSAEPLAAFVLGPLAYRDARLLVEIDDHVAAAGRSQTWPACDRNLPPVVEMTGWESRLHPLYSILVPAYHRAMLQDFRGMTSRRMHAVALAIRWYAVEHRGERPVELDELVPHYLSAVPRDPFAIDAPLRYRPGADPIIYSVGENGTDDGGSESPVNPQASSWGKEVTIWDQQDATLHLDRRPRKRADQRHVAADTRSAHGPTTGSSVKE